MLGLQLSGLITFEGKTAVLGFATHLNGWCFMVGIKTLMSVQTSPGPGLGPFVLALITRDIELLASATIFESVEISQALNGTFQTMSVGVGVGGGGGVGVDEVCMGM